MKTLMRSGFRAGKDSGQASLRPTSTRRTFHHFLRLAQERTVSEVEDLRTHFRQQGLSAEEADYRACEVVRNRFLFLVHD